MQRKLRKNNELQPGASWLVDPQGISSNRIAQLAGITKQAIGKQIDKLKKRDLLREQALPKIKE